MTKAMRFASIATLVLLSACATTERSRIPSDLLLLPVYQGEPTLRAEDLKDKILVLSFFHTECTFCEIALREVDSVHQHFSDTPDVLVLLLVAGDEIYADQDPRHRIAPYLSQYGIEAPVFWDRRAQLALHYDLRRRSRTYDYLYPHKTGVTDFRNRRPNPRSQPYVAPVLTVVVDQRGRIMHRQAGSTQTAASVIRAVEALR